MLFIQYVTQPNYPQYPLGYFPEELFEEEVPLQFIKVFQEDLKDLSDLIDKRNARIELPYTFLNPRNVDNSVALWDILATGLATQSDAYEKSLAQVMTNFI